MLEKKIHHALQQTISALYANENLTLTLEKTPKNFTGDYTLVVFPLLKFSKKKPEETAQEIGEKLRTDCPLIADFAVVKGFLNLTVTNQALYEAIQEHRDTLPTESKPPAETYLVEYSSPNTNKPLHLGHIRNNLLGYSMSKILAELGHEVKMIQIINDRGIHICKSMLAWQRYGNGDTPESTGVKGDHFVGKFYVEYEKHYQAEIQKLTSTGLSKEEAEAQSSLNQAIQKMLQDWENGDPDTTQLWQMMNQWVYDGFEQTYQRLGVHFDKNYYESNTYLLGKKVIAEGLNRGIFTKKADGSVWVDLREDGLDEKILLRSDGTAVYMTQDIGTAIERYQDFAFHSMIYTVADEQDYHFKVLFLILKKLGYDWADRCHHLSYGMVTLPSGKMKSREGTVVDADDLMDKMEQTATKIAQERGKTEPDTERSQMIGIGALKYQLLKVDPRKTVLFNPEESIDFHGKTGPFIQYTCARIQSLLNKYEDTVAWPKSTPSMIETERSLIKKSLDYQNHLLAAAQQRDPAILANYLYDLVKTYNTYYQDSPILQEQAEDIRAFRVALSRHIAMIAKKVASLLGMRMPDSM